MMHDCQFTYCGKRQQNHFFLPNTSFRQIETAILFSWQCPIKLLQNFLKWTHLNNGLINIIQLYVEHLLRKSAKKEVQNSIHKLHNAYSQMDKNHQVRPYKRHNDNTIKDSVQISYFDAYDLTLLQCSFLSFLILPQSYESPF